MKSGFHFLTLLLTGPRVPPEMRPRLKQTHLVLPLLPLRNHLYPPKTDLPKEIRFIDPPYKRNTMS